MEWNYHDKQMQKLKKIYQRISRQTQNKLQEILDTFDFSFDTLYQIADSKTKNKINTYIEEWSDKDLLTGYFGMLAKNIYTRTRVKNNEILELLIYSAYIEEQSKIQKQEQQIMYDDANYYYQEGQQEVNKTTKKKKAISVLDMALFFALLEKPNAKGYNWQQYIDSTIKYNAEQICRQITIDLQQQKEPDITNDIYQNIIKRQGNSRLNINGEKISGDVDLTLIGLNNQAKLEGITSLDHNAKVKFISVSDEKRTKMCESLDAQEFYIHNWNEFSRYSKANDSIRKYRCYGLITGLNLPPINNGFHWCRSYIVYLPVEKQEKTGYNLDIPRISKDIKPLLKNVKLNDKVKKLFNKYLTNKNIIIDNTSSGPFYYDINKDKIVINPQHSELQYYDLQKALTHEIAHMVDVRNNTKIKNIEGDIRRARIDILSNEDKYKDIFDNDIYANNMELSDIFSAITENVIAGNYMHSNQYWSDSLHIEREIKANIITAYLTDNKDFMNIVKDIKSLNNLKNEVIEAYAKRIS